MGKVGAKLFGSGTNKKSFDKLVGDWCKIHAKSEVAAQEEEEEDEDAERGEEEEEE